MKLSIERGTLLKALAQAQSVVERRNTIPILANVLIEADGAQVSFRATDLWSNAPAQRQSLPSCCMKSSASFPMARS